MKKNVKQFQKISDGLTNPLLRIGSGTASTFNANRYATTATSFDRGQLEVAYQTSWICSLMVDLLAVDMTREGITIRDDDASKIDIVNRCISKYRVFDTLCDAIKWSRLFGGSIAVIMIDGDDMSEPLSRVHPDSFRGLYVFDRWQVQPSVEKVQKLGNDFGKPVYYELIDGNNDVKIEGNRIHHSRVLRFDGRKLPYYLSKSYMGWGGSVLESIFDRVKAFDLATAGAEQLISKAYLRYYKVKGLREILTNERAREGFLAQMDHIRQFQSLEGMTVGDTEDDFQTFNYTFTGLPELLIQFGQQISGSCGIPLVRLFGQSPVGMNATGESDFRNYYDNVKQLQEHQLRPALERLLTVIYASEVGSKPDDSFDFDFVSLWQMSAVDRATTANTQAGAIVNALNAGAITAPIAMKELKAISAELGIFSSITDDDIKEADDVENSMLPPTPQEMLNDPSITVSRANENGTSESVVQEETAPSSQSSGSDNR